MSKQDVVYGITIMSSILIAIGIVMFKVNEQRHMPLPAMYITCSRDQVSENISNQPNGIGAAIAAHCVLHSN